MGSEMCIRDRAYGAPWKFRCVRVVVNPLINSIISERAPRERAVDFVENIENSDQDEILYSFAYEAFSNLYTAASKKVDSIFGVETRRTAAKQQEEQYDEVIEDEEKIVINHKKHRTDLFVPDEGMQDRVGEIRITEFVKDGMQGRIRDKWRSVGARTLPGGSWVGRTTFFILVTAFAGMSLLVHQPALAGDLHDEDAGDRHAQAGA